MACTRPSFAPDTWDDLRVPLYTAKPGVGTREPGFDVFRGAVRAYAFDGARDEDVFFAVQMPHAWRLGSEVRPHVHLGFPAAPVIGETLSFELEFTVAPTMGVFDAPGTPDLKTYTFTAADARYGHVYLPFTPIDMTGIGVSGMLICRLSRVTGGAGGTYAADVSGLEFDFHFLSDSLGTVDEFGRKP